MKYLECLFLVIPKHVLTCLKNRLFLWITITACLSIGSLQALSEIQEASDITYEWLEEAGHIDSYTDHIRHFKYIFSRYKVKAFLEFGVGYSTKFFLDECRKVISVEFVTHGYGPEWIKRCLGLYQDFSNWIPLVYFTGYQGNTDWAPYKYMGSESVYKAVSYQTVTHKNYALMDDFYMLELGAFIKNLVKYNNVNIAFVDSGLFLRGDLVQLLFDKVPVILAHDTRTRAMGLKDDVYGYSRIVCPENYEEIFVPYGNGTTIWVMKNQELGGLTRDLQVYADEIAQFDK